MEKVLASFERETPATGLALLRITFSVVLLLEVLQYAYFAPWIYDPVPFVSGPGSLLQFVILLWVPVLLALTIGWYTRAAALINLVLVFVTFGQTALFEYHVDYIYSSTALLLVLAPVGAALSVDSLVHGRRTVGRGWYYAFAVICIGLVYIDSVFYKVASPMWMRGLGVWLPASMPQAVWLPPGALTWLLDLKPVVLALGYTTLVLETLFMFVFFRPWWRPPIAIIGLGLHLGIVIAFPIPWFGLAMCAIYCVMVPLHWWGWLGRSLERIPGVVVLAGIVRRLLGSLARSGASAASRQGLIPARSLPVLILGVGLLQMAFTVFHTPLGRVLTQAVGLPEWRVPGPVAKATRSTLGVTPHPVFMDSHWLGNDYRVTVRHDNAEPSPEWLPLLREEGGVGRYLSGRTWVHFMWRCNGPDLSRSLLETCLPRAVRFWAHRSGVELEEASFTILGQPIEIQFEHVDGLLRENVDRPWSEVGSLSWREGEPHVELNGLPEQIR